MFFFLFKRETAYDMRISDWSSYVCSSDLRALPYFPPDPPRVPAALPTSDAPLASIVIPVPGQLEHTLVCLLALAAWPARAPYEVIVVNRTEERRVVNACVCTGRYRVQQDHLKKNRKESFQERAVQS